jgi:nitroreductase
MMRRQCIPVGAMGRRDDILEFLQQRNSAGRLAEPAPSSEELDSMLRCALRSPDHGWLRPWRFLSIAGAQREALGECMLASLLRRAPDASTAERDKARAAPLRAPLIITVFTALREQAKVPEWEQHLAAGCAAYGLVLAAEALGYAAIWRTGPYADDGDLARDLGAAAHEKIIGFIYVGTRVGAAKALPDLQPADFHSRWPGA